MRTTMNVLSEQLRVGCGTISLGVYGQVRTSKPEYFNITTLDYYTYSLALIHSFGWRYTALIIRPGLVGNSTKIQGGDFKLRTMSTRTVPALPLQGSRAYDL